MARGKRRRAAPSTQSPSAPLKRKKSKLNPIQTTQASQPERQPIGARPQKQKSARDPESAKLARSSSRPVSPRPPSPPSPTCRSPQQPPLQPLAKPPSPVYNSFRPNNSNHFTRAVEPIAGSSYFEAHRGQVRTSNYTLSSLDILPPAELQQALNTLPNPLQEQQDYLSQNVSNRFEECTYLLASGYSLLFYGFGSKHALLEQFASDYCAETAPVIVVDGFNPTVTMRQLLTELHSVLQISGGLKRSIHDSVRAVQEGVKSKSITLVLHNIDGPSFRSMETQIALSMLAALPKVSLVASIDHVNAPLLWDGVTYSRFSWAWIKADTFIPYQLETTFSSKAFMRGGNERQVEGAIAVLQSLSQRARKVFRLLADRQTGGEALGSGGAVGAIRTTFNDLFEHAKKEFLVTDQVSLQNILTELETHQMLDKRRAADAAAQLVIPLQIPQLREILRVFES
eukprot:GFKZ01015996.1.p1 GENE.GFKZ01015996.1~~GFKZ01015996.1.p1  ORF type:complete len:456 (+),score=52.81 GFKZ01015996.1:157-1524(+)